MEKFVFDQAAKRYALDKEVASKLQKANPQAFKNIVRRLLEANGRGMWASMCNFPHLSSCLKALGNIIPSSYTYLQLSCLLSLA